MPGTEGRQDKESPTFPVVTSHPEDDPYNLSAWIQERKQFISQLESFGDIEKWLRNKSSRSYVEGRVWERIKSRRAERRAKSKPAVTDNLAVSRYCVTSALGSLHCVFCGLNQQSDAALSQPLPRLLAWCFWAMGMSGYFPIPFQDTPPASSQPQPPLCIPYPEALIALHNLLRKRKTTLVNIFKKAGMEGRDIKKADFIKIIKQVWRAQESNKQLMLTLTFHRLQ